MQEQEILNLLTKNTDVFEISYIVERYVLRPVAWGIVKFMAWLSSLCQKFYEACFKFLDFTTYDPVEKFLGEFEGLIVIVLAISLLAISVMYIMDPQRKKSHIVNNFLIGMFVVCSSATLLTSFNAALLDGKDYIVGTYGNNGKAAYQVISDNMTDLLYIDQKIGLKNVTANNIPHSSLSEEVVKNINYGEVVEPDSENLTSSEAEEILSKKAVYYEGSGNGHYNLMDIEDGGLLSSVFSECYYRYQLNFFTVFLSLGSLCIVFIVLGYKVIRLIYELVTSQFLSIILSGEIASGQSMKKLLDFVKNIYIVLLYTLVAVKFFLLATDFVNNQFDSSLRGLVLICIAFAVIDGPVIVEKILGIDAGLQSGVGKAMAAMHMASGFARGTAGMAMQAYNAKQVSKISDAIKDINKNDLNSASSPSPEANRFNNESVDNVQNENETASFSGTNSNTVNENAELGGGNPGQGQGDPDGTNISGVDNADIERENIFDGKDMENDSGTGTDDLDRYVKGKSGFEPEENRDNSMPEFDSYGASRSHDNPSDQGNFDLGTSRRTLGIEIERSNVKPEIKDIAGKEIDKNINFDK